MDLDRMYDAPYFLSITFKVDLDQKESHPFKMDSDRMHDVPYFFLNGVSKLKKNLRKISTPHFKNN